MPSKCRVCGENLQPPSIRRNPLWGVTQWESETHCKRCLDPEPANCPFCLNPIGDEVTKCSYCGSHIERMLDPDED